MSKKANSGCNFSYWEKDSFLQPYDLIVIGAGIVGLSSALFYKKKHPRASVMVLDKGFIPEGASTRNAGFACLGTITEHLADLQKESEKNVKERIVRRYKGLELLRKMVGDEAIEYENCGGYELFVSKEKFEKAASEIARFNHWIEELVGKKKVYQPEKINGYNVIYNRVEGALNPGKMMKTLIQSVTKLGVEFKWNSTVEKIIDGGTVKLDNGWKLQANNVLVAANGFTGQLYPGLQINPARGLVMVTDEWSEIPWKGTFHHDRGYIYFRNIGNRLLIGGARNLAVNEETTTLFGANRSIKNHLIKFASETLRLPENVKIAHEWSGIMGFTPSKTPVLKRINKHTVVAAGLSGMGIAIGMKVGKTAAKLLNNR